MKEQSSISTPKIHIPNKELVGVKKPEPVEKDLVNEEKTKLPQPTGWRMLVLPFKMKEKTKGGIVMTEGTLEKQQVASAKCKPPLVFSFILNGRTNILHPVGFGNFGSDFDFFTPTKSLFGVNIDDCSFFTLLLIV